MAANKVSKKSGSSVFKRESYTKKTDLDAPPFEIIERNEPSDPYSMVNMATMNTENVYDVPDIGCNIGEKIEENIKVVKKSKKPIYLVAIFICVVLLLSIGCFVALFLEVAKLKSEIKQTETLHQINSSLRSIEDRVEYFTDFQQQLNASFFSTIEEIVSLQNSKVQQLNTSVLSRFNEIVTLQNSKVQQFNASILSSIESAIDEIVSLQNTRIQQLNASVLSSIESAFDETVSLQNRRIQQLNASVLSSIESAFDETVSLQNRRIQQLNASVLSSIEGNVENITILQNRTVQQLNNSLCEIKDQFSSFGTFFRSFSSLYPVAPCTDLPPFFHSGYYWVRNSDGNAVNMYCHITRSCGDVTEGWRRVAGLDMTNSSHQCPSELRQRTYLNKRVCETSGTGCSSVTFNTTMLEYSMVCGKIIAYQVGYIDGFRGSGIFGVDGVSLSHGISSEHIWTFVAALHEADSDPRANCPCTNSGTASLAPSPSALVGNDYFCDTGSSGPAQANIFYSDDPLWDGAGCGSLNTCCSFNNPPWFYKELPLPTTDNIKMTVCRNGNDENIAIETLEIYVQ